MWRKRETPEPVSVAVVVEETPVTRPAVIREKTPRTIVDLSAETFSQARSLLGYEPIAAVESEIARALQVVGLVPLDWKSVKAYQEVVSAEQNKNRSRPGGYWGWASTRISEYKLPIPEFALSHALAMKAQLPEAEFYVVHPQFRNPDLFLAMEYRSQSVYLDVWDEPKFEGRATI